MRPLCSSLLTVQRRCRAFTGTRCRSGSLRFGSDDSAERAPSLPQFVSRSTKSSRSIDKLFVRAVRIPGEGHPPISLTGCGLSVRTLQSVRWLHPYAVDSCSRFVARIAGRVEPNGCLIVCCSSSIRLLGRATPAVQAESHRSTPRAPRRVVVRPSMTTCTRKGNL